MPLDVFSKDSFKKKNMRKTKRQKPFKLQLKPSKVNCIYMNTLVLEYLSLGQACACINVDWQVNTHIHTQHTCLLSTDTQGMYRELKAFIEESVLMCSFDHPHVLGMIGICLDTVQSPYLLLLSWRMEI